MTTSSTRPAPGLACRLVLVSIGGSLVTVLMIGLISLLNVRAPLNPREINEIRTVLFDSRMEDRAPEPEPEPAPEPEPEKREKTETPVMTVDLDAPAPAPREIETLEFDLELPAPLVRAPRVPSRTVAAPRVPVVQTAARRAAPTGASQVDQPPRERANNPQPVYPRREQRLGIEGTVKLEILIDERGRVEDVKVLSGERAFRDAVLRVVRDWRFTPARDHGRAVKVRGVKTIKFTLRGRR